MSEREKVVLIVEDNFDNRSIYSTIMRYHGFDVLEAEDGEVGVKLAQAYRPDLILMDISMPKLDGFGARRQLLENPETAGIPVVAVTAHAMPGDEWRIMTAGFQGYLPKPILPSRVVDEVRTYLRPAA